MAPRLSIKNFLASARSALAAPASQRGAPLTFVVGNEAADLDSLCSALVLAYIRTHAPSGSNSNGGSNSSNTLHIPLSNIPRADMALRTEMAAVLNRAGLSTADLITLSELPANLEPEDTRWLLVDHNSLTGRLAAYSGQVFGCVDHHVDEGAVPADARPRTIEPSGSCMSLVVRESRASWDALVDQAAAASGGEKDEDEAELRKLATIALAPVLVDTVNFTAANKVKDSDVEAARYLGDKLGDASFGRDAYFRELSAVQEDLSQLTFRDIFRKDYKEWTERGILLGVSSTPRNLEYLVSKASDENSSSDGADTLAAELAAWAKERGLDIAGVMTAANSDGHFERQLLVWALTDAGAAALEGFAADASEKLRLEPWRDGALDGDGGRRRAWQQGDLASSRKQVAPLLRDAMKKVKAKV